MVQCTYNVMYLYNVSSKSGIFQSVYFMLFSCVYRTDIYLRSNTVYFFQSVYVTYL